MSEETRELQDVTSAAETPVPLPDDPEEEDVEESEEDEYEYEEETPEEVVYAKTEIDAPLLDVMGRVLEQTTPQKVRTMYLVGGIAAAVGGIVLLVLGQSSYGALCLIIAFFLLHSLYACSGKAIRGRLAKSDGLHWDYTVDKQGVHVGKTVNDRCIAWGVIKRGWLQEGYYLMEVQGTLVAIKQSDLNSRDRNLLELLMLENLRDCKL